MPSQILHTLFGEDVIRALSAALRPRFGPAAERLRRIPEDYPGPFALGCQGPDIFYHSQMTAPVALEYGALLHRRAYGTFTAALLSPALPASSPDRGIGALGAYALAFMTHALLDRRCHPYIIYHSGWAGRKGKGAFPAVASLGRAAHPFFERILDSLMIEYLRGLHVSAWDQEALLSEPCGDPPEGLRELLAGALRSAFPGRAGKDGKLGQRIGNALEDCAFFYRYTAPRRSSFRNRRNRQDHALLLRELPLAYLYPESLPLDIDYLNLARRPWPSPAPEGPADRRSFPEIYAAAVKEAAETLLPSMSRYLETGSFPGAEAAVGNGGLSLQDGTGKPLSPVRADPLPLDAILAQQRRLREGGAYQMV